MKILKTLKDLLGIKKIKNKKSCCAVIVAAGSGSRMNCDINKQFIELMGKPVIAYTLEAFQNCEKINEVILVAKEQEIFDHAELIKQFDFTKVARIIKGGFTRSESVMAGLAEAAGKFDYVAIHDGARPFIDPDHISEAVEYAMTYGASAVGTRLTDTIKECDEEGFILSTVDRQKLWSVQTPQVFETGLIITALNAAKEKGYILTDDCMAVEAMGIKIKMVEGSGDNIKITVPSDLAIARAILEEKGQ